jgi:carbon-monoxide dehydrogenase large subunit
MNIPATRYLGERVLRVEDSRILTGRGRYIDDLRLPGMLHAAFVRSPMAHARISSIDVGRARSLPGVVDVISGDEVAAGTAPMAVHMEMPGYRSPVFHPLATDRARHIGDPIAIVVAESRRLAEDARDAVDVDYEPLDPVVTPADAQDPTKPPIFEDMGTNVSYAGKHTDGDPDAAFAEADRVVRLSLRTPRVMHVPIDTRGGVAEFDPGTGELLYHATTQAPHAFRMSLAEVLMHPADRLHVTTPDIGGAFGQKGFVAREDIAVCFAARKLGRPLKWVEDRVENLTSALHGRGESMELTAAVRSDGTILGLDARMTLDQGAYPLSFPAALFGGIVRAVLPSSYRLQHLRWEEIDVVTNKASFGPYRGPWAIETLAREVLVDRVAAELGLDPVEVRRRNLVPLTEQPRKMATGATLEGASSLESLERAAEAIGYAAFRREQERAREQGRLLGIGFATYIEGAPGPPDMGAAMGGFPPMPERAVAQLDPDGHLTVFTAQSPHGQGHETTLAQVAATEFGIPMEHVRVAHGDTRTAPFSLIGTGGSRAATMASGAALHATRTVRRKVLTFAGSMMEIAPEDLEIVEGMIRPKDAPARAMPLAQVAAITYFNPPPGELPGFRSDSLFAGAERGGWSGGTHVAQVEVDPETGIVAIQRYLVVEDCGKMINPAIVEGQIRGGVAQGIGIALLEDAHYDGDGNFLSTTFMDYLLPGSMEVPRIEIEHLESDLYEVDYRGVGEGGTIAAPPAVVNAVADALGRATVTELPLTPERVLDLLDRHRGVTTQ